MKNQLIIRRNKKKRVLFRIILILAIISLFLIPYFSGKIERNKEIQKNLNAFLEECKNQEIALIFPDSDINATAYYSEGYCKEEAENLKSEKIKEYNNLALTEKIKFDLKSSLVYWYFWIIPIILLILAFYVRRIKSTRKLSSKID